jgi:hypothetical protein
MREEVIVVNRKHLVLSSLIALALLAVAFTPISSQQGVREYDPWVDLNGDGMIEGKDIAVVAKLFDTSGDPLTRNVNVTNWPSTIYIKRSTYEWHGDFTIPRGGWFPINNITSGFDRVTLRIFSSDQIRVFVDFYGNTIEEFDVTVPNPVLKTYQVQGSKIQVKLWDWYTKGPINAEVWIYMTA